MWNYGPNSGGSAMMWFGMIFGIIVLLIFLALIVWLIAYVSRKSANGSRAPESSRAVDLLKERYARGEIGTEEYRERLLELEGDKRG